MTEVTTLPENISGAKHLSRTVSAYPLAKIVDEFDLTNYVKRIFSGLKDLANSLSEYGLLEPITLHYSTKDDSWEMIDGRRRTGASYLLNVDYVPVKIFYDLPLEIKERLVVSLNALKEEISAPDLATLTNELEGFIRKYNSTHRSLQSPKTMREAFALLSLPHELQYCVDKKLLSKSNALLANNLSEDDQFSVLYNSLVGQQSAQKIKKSIQKKLDTQKLAEKGLTQMALFETPETSYSISLNQFEKHLLGLFNAFNSYVIKHSKSENSSSKIKLPLENGLGRSVYISMALLIKEIKSLNGDLEINLSSSYTQIKNQTISFIN